MRLFAILCWLSIPVFAWAYHVGPGQQQMQLDQADASLQQAQMSSENGDFDQAKHAFAKSLSEIPEDRKTEQRKIRLAFAKTQMESSELPEARVALEGLLKELEADETSSPELIKETRQALASAQYYMTWLMRLEGLPNTEWEPEIEASRQHYRVMAEQAKAEGSSKEFATRQHDLEAAIRLARMDLSELQALNLPCQCKGCCSGQCQGKKPSRKVAKKNEKKGKSAGLGPLPDGNGS
ncbi:hypothetical protein [Rubinisphaera sp.]|uniref:hypothetical protein n=1 Tax=Rubinisphaera sp. TaxID=2024857 RepID=UPI000C0FFE45|nr:hypothetical protein [Rubinisphaera sp.]MBV11352.1 hypothetical protein [Rubinisphaera sp.]|tara:strand:- start:15503 stop:16216 length:714 start_codon:yes stop_codon:yes gene_type:complete